MEKPASIPDGWTAGSAYEAFMGRWSRQLAAPFVSWLEAPRRVHWLDVGCGTGALAKTICTTAYPASVTGCDPAGPLIEFARANATDPCITYKISGVEDLPRRRGGFACVTSLLALNFFPDPEAAVGEMHARASRHGTVSACVWDYSGRMEFLRLFWDAAAALDPAARALDEGRRFPLCEPDALTVLFRSGGLTDVRCEAIDIPTIFAGFTDYWRPFLGRTGPAPSYVASLDAAHRDRLSGRLEASLPRAQDGTIRLTARAWAVRGSVAH